MANAILYQAYGGIDFINECRYSLLKYLQVYNLKPPAKTGIFIYTDQSHLFSDYLPFFQQLEFIPLTTSTVKQWQGRNNFVHRFKIEMMADFLTHFDGNLLYCDTDTYATTALEDLFGDIEKGNFYMHEYEGLIDRTKFPSFHKWENFLSTTSIDYNSKQVRFSKTLQMFNAGVVGLSSNNKEVLNDILALTDSIFSKFPKHIAEQFAFSYCLQKQGTIKPADYAIAHYWNLKEFRRFLETFFSKNEEESIPNLVKKIHHVDALTIMKHKTSFESLPFLQRFLKKLGGSSWRISTYEKKL
jgi:hypothetical protein